VVDQTIVVTHSPQPDYNAQPTDPSKKLIWGLALPRENTRRTTSSSESPLQYYHPYRSQHY